MSRLAIPRAGVAPEDVLAATDEEANSNDADSFAAWMPYRLAKKSGKKKSMDGGLRQEEERGQGRQVGLKIAREIGRK